MAIEEIEDIVNAEVELNSKKNSLNLK